MPNSPLNFALLNALPLAKRLVRQPNANKSHSGKVLLIGGSIGMAGALILSARATLYSGAGWTLLSMLDGYSAHALEKQAELMIQNGSEVDPISELQRIQAQVIAIGPGLGKSELARRWLGAVLKYQANALHLSAIVLDADALNLIAENPDLLTVLQTSKVPCILTPHPGEAARLLRTSSAVIQEDREASMTQLVSLCHHIVVLKGQHTLLASPNQTGLVCAEGNAGLAVGGTGDVLTGLIASLAAQGIAHQLNPWEAACLGVQVHALAADRLLKKNRGSIGMTPSELILEIRQTLNDLL
ncbi:MAG: NAD(P)H-hydrate dehydratase [Polynucleobacter sp.]|nr:NAD(P)H-hydrate dehydratase [Polynucleobacter sp.]MDZ4057252.1 NAD(P)H-hydrate dehydratase [Polynucleobacter sp.]